MRKFLNLGLLIAALIVPLTAKSAPVLMADYEKVVYVSAYITSTQSALNTGRDYANAKGFFDGTLYQAPAGCVLSQMYVIVDEAVSGLTLFSVGDAGSSTGFISSASSPLASTGLMYFNAVSKGAYLKYDSTNAAAKYYSSATNILLDVTGTATAGKIRIVMRGFCLGV